MFNLIRRDAIIQKWQLYIFLPFILFFIYMDSHPALIFLIASIYIPFNAYAYDEKAETNILLNSLPYTRQEIISSRFLGAIVYMILAVSFTSLVLFIFNKPFTFTDIAIGSSLFLLFSALTFPLFYIFKPGYITPVVLISFLFLAGIGPNIVTYLAERLTLITNFIMNLSVITLYTGSAIMIMAIYAMSWGATTLIYQRKVF